MVFCNVWRKASLQFIALGVHRGRARRAVGPVRVGEGSASSYVAYCTVHESLSRVATGARERLASLSAFGDSLPPQVGCSGVGNLLFDWFDR